MCNIALCCVAEMVGIMLFARQGRITECHTRYYFVHTQASDNSIYDFLSNTTLLKNNVCLRVLDLLVIYCRTGTCFCQASTILPVAEEPLDAGCQRCWLLSGHHILHLDSTRSFGCSFFLFSCGCCLSVCTVLPCRLVLGARAYFGRANVSRKTLVDSRFLLWIDVETQKWASGAAPAQGQSETNRHESAEHRKQPRRPHSRTVLHLPRSFLKNDKKYTYT